MTATVVCAPRRTAAALGLAAKRPTVDNLTSGMIVAVGAGEQER